MKGRNAMKDHGKPITILMAEDNEGDCRLTQEAMKRARLANNLVFVKDGVDLLDYLQRRGAYEDPAASPRPGLILLDLNMPRKDGRAALEEIKLDPSLRKIPVVVLTSSQAASDVVSSYDTGVSGYIIKPVTFEGLVEVMKGLSNYWFEIVELPLEQDRPQND
jgi:CheY-like chemotaxis protein